MSSLRAFAALVRTELARLLRTPAVVRVVIVPVVFLVPSILLAFSLGMGPADHVDRVLVPADLPESLGTALEVERMLQVEVVADPLAAYAEGTGHAAVVRWVRGDGLGEVHVAHGPGQAVLYEVAVAAGSQEVAHRVREALEAGGRAEVEGWIAAHGVDPDTLPGATRLVSATPEPDFIDRVEAATLPGTAWPIGRLFRAALVLLAVLPGAQLLPILGAHERETGVALLLAVAPPGASLRLGARLVAFCGFLMACGGLLAFTMVLPLLALPARVALWLWLLDVCARAAISLFAGSALALVLGESVSDPSHAVSMGGIVIYIGMGTAVAAVLLDLPWIPLGGLALVAPGLPLLGAALLHLGLTVLLVLLAGRLHRWRLGTGT